MVDPTKIGREKQNCEHFKVVLLLKYKNKMMLISLIFQIKWLIII